MSFKYETTETTETTETRSRIAEAYEIVIDDGTADSIGLVIGDFLSDGWELYGCPWSENGVLYQAIVAYKKDAEQGAEA